MMAKSRRTERSKENRRSQPVATFRAGIIREPSILLGGQHQHVDPKTGLSLYGPYSLKGENKPILRSINVGIVGPPSMIADAEQWIDYCRGTVLNDGSNPFWLPHYPGCTADEGFRCELVTSASWRATISMDDIHKALALADHHVCVQTLVDLYVEALSVFAQREPKPNVVLCCIPKEIVDGAVEKTNRFGESKPLKLSKEARALREKIRKEKQADRKSGQLPLFDIHESNEDTADEEPGHQNLRRGIKAESMRFTFPTQLVWPRTLNLNAAKATPGDRPLQDPATRAWNFITAMYHKAGGTPWRIADIDPTTCFVGISFYREVLEPNPMLRTAMAQAFTATGDGYVLRGESFEFVKSRSQRSPHLTASAAASLIRDVIDLFKKQNRGSVPGRVVIHKSSQFWQDELNGFKTGCENIPNLDMVSLGDRGLQFYRPGRKYPPVRGTFIKFSDTEFALYTSGYIPYLKTYPGPRAPRPLEIMEFIGETPWDQMLNEILSLTKMNWNTADFNCSEPITLAFARKVGHVLAEMPAGLKPKEEYRFYM